MKITIVSFLCVLHFIFHKHPSNFWNWDHTAFQGCSIFTYVPVPCVFDHGLIMRTLLNCWFIDVIFALVWCFLSNTPPTYKFFVDIWTLTLKPKQINYTHSEPPYIMNVVLSKTPHNYFSQCFWYNWKLASLCDLKNWRNKSWSFKTLLHQNEKNEIDDHYQTSTYCYAIPQGVLCPHKFILHN